jgi:hypothetical protein
MAVVRGNTALLSIPCQRWIPDLLSTYVKRYWRPPDMHAFLDASLWLLAKLLRTGRGQHRSFRNPL